MQYNDEGETPHSHHYGNIKYNMMLTLYNDIILTAEVMRATQKVTPI
jgi:hypothetical protein